jgi:DNA invertase Pin-like site-specific DNA recombinase
MLSLAALREPARSSFSDFNCWIALMSFHVRHVDRLRVLAPMRTIHRRRGTDTSNASTCSATHGAASVQKSRISHQSQALGPIVLYCCISPVHNRPMIYGYARVSTDGQSVDAQVKELRAAGATKVYRETASGVRTERAQLRRVLDQLDAGDLLMVTRLDRLARSTRDLLNTLHTIGGKGAGFRSLGDVWADTTTPHGRLMLTVLGGLAEFERELIRARTHEGRVRAVARGVKLGRTPKLTPHQRREAIKRRDAGEAMREIARSYNVSHSTISRLSP